MAGNMAKEEAMLNYIEELQKVQLVCIRRAGIYSFVLTTDC